MFHNPKRRPPQTRLIAVCGTAHGAGVTHLALALGNYLASKRGETVSYYEVNGSGQIASLFSDSDHRQEAFCGMTLYAGVGPRELTDFYQPTDTYRILDLGIPGPLQKSLLHTCNLCLVLGMIQPWCLDRYARQVKDISFSQERKEAFSVLYLGNSLETKLLHKAQKSLSHPILGVPYLPNPFQIPSSDWPFFESLLERI